MYRYSVLIDPQHEAQLAAVTRLDPEVVIEYVASVSGVEQWHVTTEHDIDSILDSQPGVISYEVVDLDELQSVYHKDK
jgi:hypothetical protein